MMPAASPVKCQGPGISRAELARTAAGLQRLLRHARARPGKTRGVFRRWYWHLGPEDMPAWAIERSLDDEVQIHLWDFAVRAIEPRLREHCRRKGLDLTARRCKDSLVARHLFISKGGKPLLRMHTTFCSVPGDSSICVHLRPDAPSLGLLVDLFKFQMGPEDMAYYRKIYTRVRRSHKPRSPQ
jgi:hypothetical protein